MPPVIDAHQHFWDIERFTYPWMSPSDAVLYRNYLPSDLKPLMDDVGVHRCVFVQANHDVNENRWVLELADQHDFIAGVVGWVDLTAADVDETLAEFAAHPKFVGIRHITHDEPDDDWIVRDDVLRGLKLLKKHNLTFDLLFRPQHLKHVPRLVREMPEQKFVIDHIAKPRIREGVMDGWLEDMRVAASIENVYCKLSGMITEADHERWTSDDLKPFVAQVVDMFGFDRVMFGSDWPVCNLAGNYSKVFVGLTNALVDGLGPISLSDQELLFGGTAAGFYGLDVE